MIAALSLTHNVTLTETLGTLWAVLVFVLVLYAPGYLTAYATDVFGFRAKKFAERSIWAIACSVLVSPILSHLVGRAGGLLAVCWTFGAAGVGAGALLARGSKDWSASDRRFTAYLALGWTAFVLLMMVDWQWGPKLFFSVPIADGSYRVAFVDAVVRTGVPPSNPLYFAGPGGAMHYYYFWYVLCAAVVKIARVPAFDVFLASCIWGGFALLSVVHLFTTEFFRWGAAKRGIALGLLAVTGADLLPSVGNAILQPTLNGDIEWWSVDPIDAWPDSLLWVPHHVASVLCCVMALLLLWRAGDFAARRARIGATMLAGAAFASAFGLSCYVAVGFAGMMLAWLLWLLVRRAEGRARIWRRTLAATAVGSVLLVPFLAELIAGFAHPTAAGEPKQHLFALSARQMIDSGLLTGLPVFAHWNATHPVLLDQALRIALLLPGLALELGLYGAALIYMWVARRKGEFGRTPARDTALFFTTFGLILTMFVSSSVITNNDFGYRAVMLPSFFLLLLTADLLGSWKPAEQGAVVRQTRARRRVLRGLFWLGVSGTVYGAVLLRAWLPIEMRRPHGFEELPADDYQIHEVFGTLDRTAAKDAVVAFRPIDPEPHLDAEVMTPNEYYQRMLVMDTGRQMLNAEKKCAVHFGGDASVCHDMQDAMARLYSLPAPSADAARAFCSRFGAQYLFLSHRDPNWGALDGWPVTLPVIARRPGVRILRCF